MSQKCNYKSIKMPYSLTIRQIPARRKKKNIRCCSHFSRNSQFFFLCVYLQRKDVDSSTRYRSNNNHFALAFRKEVITHLPTSSCGDTLSRLFLIVHRTWTWARSSLLDHIVVHTISIRMRIGVGGFVKLDERKKKKERERKGKGRRNNPMAEAGGKGTRQRAGNRARVEFALTRPVAASGVVARLVAGRVNSNPETDNVHRVPERGSKKCLLRVLDIVCPSRARRIKFLARWKEMRAKVCLYFRNSNIIGRINECDRRAAV